MSFFTLETFQPAPKPASLEAHLIEVATRWAEGRSTIKVTTLDSFESLLKHEASWYKRDNKVAAAEGVEIFIDRDGSLRPSLILKSVLRTDPSIRIHPNLALCY